MDFYTMFNASTAACNNYLFFEKMRDVTVLILYPVFCCVGIVTNGICILVLTRKKKRSPTHHFLLGLTISELIHVLNDLLYFAFMFVSLFDVETSMYMMQYIYPYSNYLFQATLMFTAWVTVSIATDRYVNVCHSKKARYYITYKRGVIVVIVIAIVTLIISVPHNVDFLYLITSNRNVSIHTEIHHLTFENIYHGCYYIIRVIVPVLFLIIFSALILHRLKRTRIRNGKRKTTINIILGIVSFIVCVTPDMIVSTMSRVHRTNYLVQGLSEFTRFLLLLNCSINAVIYCALNTQFMKTLKGLCRMK